jgi:nicotinamide-nucleotide amidase
MRVTAKGKSTDEAAKMCDEVIERIRETEVGKYIYGVDVGSIENAVLLKLRAEKKTLASAESCTGGYIAKRITDLSGASEVFLGSAVTYANEAKIRLLGVKEETLARVGAVSEEVAIEMAEGIRRALGADVGISTTGIAGPTGGTDEKPVGTVYIAISTKNGTRAKRLNLSPQRDRDYIRTVSATNALALVLEEE